MGICLQKDKKLLDALEFEPVPQDSEDESSGDEDSSIVFPTSLSFDNFNDKTSNFGESDAFYSAIHSNIQNEEESDFSNDESDDECSFTDNSTATQDEYWQRNPLHTKKFTITSSKNSENFL